MEYDVKVPEYLDQRLVRMSQLLTTKYQLKVIRPQMRSDLTTEVDSVFHLLTNEYSELHGFVPYSPQEIRYYTRQYLQILVPQMVLLIKDQDDKLLAFGIALPSLARAFQKSSGRLFPFGWYQIQKALKHNDTAELLLIAVDREWRKKGLTGIIFKELIETFQAFGIRRVETNPELETNHDVRALWGHYNHRLHKKRVSYRMDL